MAQRRRDQLRPILHHELPSGSGSRQVEMIEAAGRKAAAIRVQRIARHFAEPHESERAVKGLRRIAGAHVEQQQRAAGAQRTIAQACRSNRPMPRRRCERRTISFITSARCRPFARGSRPS